MIAQRFILKNPRHHPVNVAHIALHTNTFKLSVSLSPICYFNIVSKLFTGCISDKELVRQSGFLAVLEEREIIMASKGFNIQDLLAIHRVRLIAPPIMTNNTVSARASTATRRVANARVHVERIVKKQKCFYIWV